MMKTETPPGVVGRPGLGRLLFRRTSLLGWIAVWLSLILTFEYYARIEQPQMEARIELHQQIVDGTSSFEKRYRVLIPFAVEALARAIELTPLSQGRPATPPLAYSRRTFALSYCALNLAALITMLWCLGALISRLLGFDRAIAGMALTALIIGLTFRDHYYHPWSLSEGAFFALGLLLIHLERYWAFTILTVVAVINRETSLFLNIAFFFIALPASLGVDALLGSLRERRMRFAAGNLGVWLAGYLGLQMLIGYHPAEAELEAVIQFNLSRAGYAVVLNLLAIGFVAPIVVRGILRGPEMIRRASLMLPLYFGLLLVIGYWWEIRYWIAVLPIVVPALLAGLHPDSDGPTLPDPRAAEGP